ncbi:11720_t:CDS:1, partial [Racocetra persica]
SEIDDLVAIIENFHFSNPMQVEEFLSIPDETLAYKVLDNNHVISKLVEIFKVSDTVEDSDNIDKIDNSLELPIVSTDSVFKGLETTYMYLLQDNTSM